MKTDKTLALVLLTGGLLPTPARSADTDSTATGNTRPLHEVVVTGTRDEADIRRTPSTVSVIGRKQIEQSHNSSLLPVLTEQVPGLFITSRGIMGYGVSGGAAGGISLRGLAGGSGRVMVLIDGHPQYMGLMGHPISDAYQSPLAERVEVLRGPASVLYGSNAMGGVINIITRQMQAEGVRTDVDLGYGSYNTLQAEATNRVRQGRFTSIASASYNRTDGHRPDMGFEQFGGYVKLGYALSKAWDIRADVDITHFNASQPGETSAPLLDADQRITRGMASMAVENHYGRTSGALSLFYNWGRHNINDGYTPGDSPLDYRFHSRDEMMGVSWYQNARIFRGNQLTVGADWFRMGGEAWNQYVAGEQNGKRQDIVDRTRNEVAGYIDFRQDIAPWLALNAGLRIDYHEEAGTEWIPQAGLAFVLPRNADIKLTASRGFRHPLIREMFMWGAANPNLEAESLWNYEAAFSQNLLEGRLTYGANIFYIRGDNMIATASAGGRMRNVNTGKIENAGTELQAAYRISRRWSVDANYSYLHMAHPVVSAPEHKLYAGAAFTQGRWNLTTGVQYVQGLYTQVKTNGQGDETQENFVLWNVRGSFRATKFLDIWVRGENLLAQRYETMAGYPMPKATFMGGVRFQF